MAPDPHFDAMRVLIQDYNSHEYYIAPGCWSRNALEALDFHETRKAMAAIRELGLSNVHVVLKFHKEELDVNVKPGSREKPR
jgi:hypothetical protein